ncbi:MAG: phosphopantetheine-binding protein [Acidobacteriota bacterium]|nr:phosphopantetheine-binding protein [Acidobacteriota bacterium]
MPSGTATRERLKRTIIESLNLEGMTPEMIDDEAPLFGDGLGLDSVDALELVVALEKEYGVSIDSEAIGQDAFASVASLETFVEGLQSANGSSAETPSQDQKVGGQAG